MTGATDGGLSADRRGREPGRSALDAHVDELFTTAIEHQVAEQRELNRLLGDLERSLTAVRGRLDELQDQVAHVLGARLDELGARSDAQAETVRKALEEQDRSLRQRLDAADAAQHERSQVLRAAVDNELADLETLAAAITGARALDEEARDALRRELVEAVSGELPRLLRDELERVLAAQREPDDRRGEALVAERVSAMVEELRLDVGEALERHSQTLEDRLAAVAEVLEEARAAGQRVADLEKSLVTYVTAWGDRVAVERKEVVEDVLARLTEGLPRRGRRRMAGQLAASPALRPARGGDPAPPAVPIVPTRKVVKVPPRPAPPTPSTGEDDESSPAAEIRSVLAGVRGVGPAKRSALIDAFGDLEGLRAAAEEELAEVDGIGPALAASIHRALH